MRFSERHGHKTVRDTFQLERMDDPLRNGIWNGLQLCYWSDFDEYESLRESEVLTYVVRLWLHFFKRRVDERPTEWRQAKSEIKDYFFSAEWSGVYDFLEFTLANYVLDSYRSDTKEQLVEFCNSILEREMAGYRLVNDLVTPITSNAEAEAIEEAIQDSADRATIGEHLNRALQLLSDRDNPDYRNSIKESISAVESACRAHAGDDAESLNLSLQSLSEKWDVHPAFRQGIEKLYGWTSDEDGIRHALMDRNDVAFEEAKFMLVACSGFVNYLRGMAAKS